MSNYYFNHAQHSLGCGHKASTAPLNVIFKLCHDYAQLRSISGITAHMPLAPLPTPPAPSFMLSIMLACTHSGLGIQLVNYISKLSLRFHFYFMCFGMPGSSQYPCPGFWGKNLEFVGRFRSRRGHQYMWDTAGLRMIVAVKHICFYLFRLSYSCYAWLRNALCE